MVLNEMDQDTLLLWWNDDLASCCWITDSQPRVGCWGGGLAVVCRRADYVTPADRLDWLIRRPVTTSHIYAQLPVLDTFHTQNYHYYFFNSFTA